MKDLKEKNVQMPREEESSQPEAADEQERQFWLDAKYPDESGDSDR